MKREKVKQSDQHKEEKRTAFQQTLSIMIHALKQSCVHACDSFTSNEYGTLLELRDNARLLQSKMEGTDWIMNKVDCTIEDMDDE